MHPLRRIPGSVMLLAVGVALSACQMPPPQPRFPEITFQHLPPVKLDVREVKVEQAYLPPNEAPNVEHLFPVRPGAAAERWARDRLVAAGPGRRARYIVREASVVEVALKTSDGLQGAITIEQSERYDARIVVEVQIIAENGQSEGALTVEAVRSRSVPEDLTLNQREQVWFEMTEALARDLDAVLEKTIRTVFARYLVP